MWFVVLIGCVLTEFVDMGLIAVWRGIGSFKRRCDSDIFEE
jgi:hypothetical protein